MIIAHRLEGMGWLPENRTNLDSLFDLSQWWKAVFVARNQKEYDTLRGYELIYGVKLPLIIEESDLDRIRQGYYYLVFLWVDFPNNPD